MSICLKLSNKLLMTWTSLDTGTENPAVVTKMNITLSADHCVFEEKVAGEYWCKFFSIFQMGGSLKCWM